MTASILICVKVPKQKLHRLPRIGQRQKIRSHRPCSRSKTAWLGSKCTSISMLWTQNWNTNSIPRSSMLTRALFSSAWRLRGFTPREESVNRFIYYPAFFDIIPLVLTSSRSAMAQRFGWDRLSRCRGCASEEGTCRCQKGLRRACSSEHS